MPDDIWFPASPSQAVRQAALTGLLAPRKTLPAWLFYDEEGCRLFYRITELPEYYLTRTEVALLPEVARAVSDGLGDEAILVEYGASDETKARFLLSPSGRAGVFRHYVPVDVAGEALHTLKARLSEELPTVAVHPVVADFQQSVVLPELPKELPRLGFFPGSTIGNLDPAAASAFLRCARESLGSGAQFLLGADLRKDLDVLVPAYDDAQGITAAFNRNLLIRLNRELGTDFMPDRFEHRILWNDHESRIEMHLQSRVAQSVRLGDHVVRFAAGETIHTENSYKHRPERVIAIAREGGWRVVRQWTDPQDWFGLFLCVAD